jgi:hypothetical protein
MKKRKVISHKNLPAKLPTVLTFMVYILLDKFNAPQWLWGGLGAVMLVLWVATIAARQYEEDTDIFKQ